MGTLNEDLSSIKEVEDKIVANKVARFAYTNEAYKTNDADGVDEYDVDNAQNIPIADASVLKVNETVLSKGYRAQASSITRMLVNHFFGRMSYNLNKVNDNVSNLIETLISHRGTADGFATLDENGRIPYSQLPESAMEYKGQWNAKTNTPTLADGTGTKGDFYIVSVSGTQNLGSGNVQCFENDRIIYDGSIWSRLSAGDVKTVNRVLPANGNVALTGENIPVSPTDPTLLSAPLTTERIADNAVTNAKIKDPVSVAKGGTGQTTAIDAANAFINSLELGTAVPKDEDYYVCQWAGGNSETPVNTTYTRRPISKLWDYIKDKISSALGLTKDNYGGKAATAANADTANNATYADKVKNALTINGQSFDGSSPVTFNISTGTDTKVNQNVSANNNTYPILASDTANKSTSGPGEAIISNLLTMNPSTGNMTGWSNGSAYTICASSSSATRKDIMLPGITLTAGMTVTVLFYYGNSAAAPNLNVNSTGYEKPIKVYLNGSKTTVTTQWDAGTSMTLMYDGTDFVVLGNPVVMSQLAETSGYIQYANGLLIQWGLVLKATSKDDAEIIMFPIGYIQIPVLNATWITYEQGAYSRLNIMSIAQTQAVIRNTDHKTDGYTWMSIGW